MDIVNSFELRVIFQIFLAAILGGIVGIEREHAKKAAGTRTYALVSLGAAFFTIISRYGFKEFIDLQGFDPSRIASQVVVGVGFLGAGLIIFRGLKVEGLTTAAGLWVAAAIGMAVGVEFYLIAVFASLFVFVIIAGMKALNLEGWLERHLGRGAEEPKEK